MKNKFILAALLVAIFIPSVVAIVSYNTSDKVTVVRADLADVVTVADLDGKEFVFKNDNDEGKAVISQLQQMIDRAEAIPALPEAISGDSFYKVTFSVDKLETVYKFYFASDGNDTYLVNSEGEAKKVTAALTEEFLATDFAQSIYTYSHAPTLTLSGEHTVLPLIEGENASSWMYTNSTGTFVAALFDGSNEPQSYDVEGGLSLVFDNEPDNLAVRVANTNGEELFNDQYSAIGSLELKPGDVISVEISAKWYEEETREYYGKMNYAFEAKVSAAAEFYPGVTSLDQGGIVSITALNVKNPDKISISCDPAVTFEPVWYRDGEYCRTLLCFDPELTPGTYTLTFDYAGTSQNVALELTNAGFSIRDYTVDDAVYKKSYSAEALEEFKTEFEKIVKESSDTRLWNGSFLADPTSGLPISAGFGHMFNLTNAQVSFRHVGVDYKGAGDVLADNDGKVVYVGELDYTGKLIVIDHGWGLKTWYAHLSDIGVALGDEVKRGDKIGAAGDTGFTNQVGLHVSMTLWDKYVLPYSTWDDNGDYASKGIPLGIPLYEKQS